MIRLNAIKLELNENEDCLKQKAAKALKIKEQDILSLAIAKKSVDARKKDSVCFIYSLDIELKTDEKKAVSMLPENIASLSTKYSFSYPKVNIKLKERPVVCGFGPCGMFAALYLANAGLNPLVIERGEEVEKRQKSVELMMKYGILNTESNIQFGEGGAGTFSDGKLTSGIKSDKSRLILESFVKHGAPGEILYLQRPHIGTDLLPNIVKSIRDEIISLGGEIMFSSKLCDINIENGKITGLTVSKNGEKQSIACDKLILATGHSSRDTLFMLRDKGIKMQRKPFSVGVRIEHRQSLIDRAQYGSFAGDRRLPVSEYHLSAKTRDGRGVYSFCMCPGGTVVPAASEENRLCTNGMSEFRRDKVNANAAILVDVRPDDFEGDDVLAGIMFQREIEEKAYMSGGGKYIAPAQLVGDFLCGRESKALLDVMPSYEPGIKLGDISPIFPNFVLNGMKDGIMEFDKKLRGFAYKGAVMTAVEARSSCPLRIERNEFLQANVSGLYPAGEGAGYAGGIMSAAVDGIRCAERLIENLGG